MSQAEPMKSADTNTNQLTTESWWARLLNQEPFEPYSLKCSDEEYDDLLGLRSTSFKKFCESPVLFRLEEIDGMAGPSKPQFAVGTALHQHILEGKCLKDVVRVYPGGRRQGKKYDEWKAESDVPDVLQADYDLINDMAMGMLRNTRATEIIMQAREAGDCEYSVVWTDEKTGLPLKAKLDILDPDNAIADLKTSRAKNGREFFNDAHSYGYHISLAWYERGRDAVFGPCSEPSRWIVASKSWPHYCRVYQMPEEMRRSANLLIDKRLAELRMRIETDDWTDPADESDQTLDVPSWFTAIEDGDLAWKD